MTCREIEPLLASYVDGAAEKATWGRVREHLATCASCRRAADAQAAARSVLRARAAHLAPHAPPALHTRVEAMLGAHESGSLDVLGWRGRLSALAAAAMFLLVVGGVALPVISGRSTILLAAQLALDHLKCFTIEGDGTAATIAPERAAAELQDEYGWTMPVPTGRGGPDDPRLVGVRRCLYGDGRAAHLMYRVGDAPVSLFVIPGLERPAQELSLLGHDQIVWTDGGKTFMLIGRSGAHDRLQHVASQLRNRAE